MRALLIGGAGLLGRELCSLLSSAGYEVAICDNFTGSLQYRAPKGIRVFSANATDLNAMSHVFSVFKPTIVVSCLGHYFAPDSIYKRFDDMRLVLDAANVLSYLLNTDIKQVLFCSSHEVYSGSSRKIKESRKAGEPYSHHGAAKLAAESILAYQCGLLGINLCTFRVFDLYGPRQMFCSKTGPLSFLIDAILTNQQAGLAGPKRLRDFIHVSDAASALVHAVESNLSGTYNLGTSKGVTFVDICREINRHLEIVYPPKLMRDSQGKKKSLVADTSLLEQVLPTWSPKVEVLSAIPELIEFRKQELALYNNSPASSARLLSAMRGRSDV